MTTFLFFPFTTCAARARRALRGLVAAAVLALAVVSPVPSLAVTVVGDTTGLNPADIDPAIPAVLTVMKTPPNPYDDRGAEYPGVSGRHLVLNRLQGIDITTREGFDKARALDFDEASTLAVADTRELTTDADGKAVFADLVPGLYILGERQPENPTRAYFSSVPLLITLPVGRGDKHAWAYLQEVDLKDQLTYPPSLPGDPSGSSIIPALALIPVIIGGVHLGFAAAGSSDPETPAQPAPALEQPVTPTPKKGIAKLARTGANSLQVVGLGGGIVAAGLILFVLASLRRRRQS